MTPTLLGASSVFNLSAGSPVSPSAATDGSSPSPAIPDFSKGIDGLLPVIAQDAEGGRVLMLAWMNEAAWRETVATGQATYFSRSRGELWRKGETSGHRQRVVEMRVDCDADAILLQVEQIGAACHEGYQSCFFRQIDRDGSVRVTERPVVDPASVYGSQS